MKQLLIILALLIASGNAFANEKKDIRDIFNGLGKSDSTSSKSANGKLGGILGAVGTLAGLDKIAYKDLVGNWNYASPAVSFKSDNLLKKAGGMAAAEQIEAKIKPFYEKAGIEQLSISFANDSIFTMTLRRVKLSGTVSTAADGQFVFSFKASGKIKLGKMNAYIKRVDTQKVALTFDASKLITLVEKISNISGNSTLKSASSLLSSYDGLTIGFDIKKQ